MARWRACAAGTVTLLAALLIDGAAATCPTFVAWLDASKNQHGETVGTNVVLERALWRLARGAG